MVYERPLRPDELMHYGVKGQKWGVRRYQNQDGTLTEAGKKHYGSEDKKKKSLKEKWNDLNPKTRTAIKVGAGLAVAGLAAYGGYKAYKYIKQDKANWKMVEEIRDRYNKADDMARKASLLDKIANKGSTPPKDAVKAMNEATDLRRSGEWELGKGAKKAYEYLDSNNASLSQRTKAAERLQKADLRLGKHMLSNQERFDLLDLTNVSKKQKDASAASLERIKNTVKESQNKDSPLSGFTSSGKDEANRLNFYKDLLDNKTSANKTASKISSDIKKVKSAAQTDKTRHLKFMNDIIDSKEKKGLKAQARTGNIKLQDAAKLYTLDPNDKLFKDVDKYTLDLIKKNAKALKI